MNTTAIELWITNAMITLNGSKKMYQTVEAAQASLAKLGREHLNGYKMPSFCRKTWEEIIIAGTPCIVKKGTVDSTILYLHGGAYFIHASTFSYSMLNKLTKRTHSSVVLPVYALAPEATFELAYQQILDVYQELVRTVGVDSITLMGDSAGGGLCVGLALEAARLGLPKPKRLVLISPYLDITLTNPAIPAIEPYDRMLVASGLREIGLHWAGDTIPTDPRLSPLYGDLSTLGDVLMFSGTDDILNPDARLLAEKLRSLGKTVQYIEEAKHPHVYPLLPMAAARRSIVSMDHFIQPIPTQV